jgi:hypothetical protein
VLPICSCLSGQWASCLTPKNIFLSATGSEDNASHWPVGDFSETRPVQLLFPFPPSPHTPSEQAHLTWAMEEDSISENWLNGVLDLWLIS